MTGEDIDKEVQRQKRKAMNREMRLHVLYGLEFGEWDKIFESQGFKCAICKKSKSRKRMDTDHCHKTGVVRGILCHKCNVMLGHARDNHEILAAGAEYLRKFVPPVDLEEQLPK